MIPEMKKATYTIICITVGLLSLASCKKSYHCSCSFNNRMVYTVDLGREYEDNAKEKCSSYDSTITGEVWNCGIY